MNGEPYISAGGTIVVTGIETGIATGIEEAATVIETGMVTDMEEAVTVIDTMEGATTENAIATGIMEEEDAAIGIPVAMMSVFPMAAIGENIVHTIRADA